DLGRPAGGRHRWRRELLAVEARQLARRLANRHEEAEAIRSLGRVALRRNDLESAEEHYSKAIPVLMSTVMFVAREGDSPSRRCCISAAGDSRPRSKLSGRAGRWLPGSPIHGGWPRISRCWRSTWTTKTPSGSSPPQGGSAKAILRPSTSPPTS